VKLKSLRVAKLMKVDPTVIKAVAKELRITGATNTSIAVENVLRIEGLGRVVPFLALRRVGTGNICKVNETYLLRLRKVPFANMFVSLLSNLKAGQDSAGCTIHWQGRYKSSNQFTVSFAARCCDFCPGLRCECD
jgi:hypothetical protein